MGRPIPEDDTEIEELVQETAELETEETEEETDTEVTAPSTEEEEEEVEEEELSESALEALLTDERAGWVPEKRVKELVSDRDAARRDADLARDLAQQLLADREARNKPAAVVEAKRDFDAELKDIKAKYKAGDLDAEEYMDARESLTMERAEAAAEAKFKPVVEQLQSQAQRAQAERQQSDMDKAAAAIYAKFPFLDISSKSKNEEAIGQVLQVRDELIRSGVSAVRAMKLAAMEVGPEFEGEVTEEAEIDPESNVTAIRDKRAAAARKAAADAANATPASIAKAGQGTKVNPGKVTLTRSVEDAERYSNMTEEQKKQVVF